MDMKKKQQHSSSCSSSCPTTVGLTSKNYPPPPELARKLCWPSQPNLNGLSTFFFVGLCEDASAHPK